MLNVGVEKILCAIEGPSGKEPHVAKLKVFRRKRIKENLYCINM